MPTPPGKVPILESAASGFSFLRANIVAAAAAAAIVAAPVALLETSAQRALLGGDFALGWLVWLAALYAGVVFHAALLRLAMRPQEAGPPVRLGGDEARLAGAMSVVGFFLFIVSVPGLFLAVIAFGVIAQPYADRLQSAQGDIEATMALMREIVRARPAEILLLLALLAFAWLALTSRLYLVAPATIAEGRARTFETWSWTKGAMLRIIAARLILLVPAFLAASIIQQAVLVLAGGAEALASQTTPFALAAAARFASTFFFLLIYATSEAGLSAFLYRGLRPAQ